MSLANEIDRLHDLLSQEQMKYVSKLKRDTGDDARISKYFTLINSLLVNLNRFKNMKNSFDLESNEGDEPKAATVKARKEKIEKKMVTFTA